jgi:hypothetical protein
MHRPPGSPRRPEGSRNESMSWKPVAEKRSCREARSLAGFIEFPPRPTEPNGCPRCEHRVRAEPRDPRAPHRRFAVAGVTTVFGLTASEPASPPDSTVPDYELRRRPLALSTLRLDTPTAPAVARCRRRFVSTSDDVIAVDSQPGNARPMWGLAGTLPQRCRHGAIPTDPARQETPDTFGTQNVPIGFASQHGWLLTMHHGDPEGPPWCPQPHAYQC